MCVCVCSPKRMYVCCLSICMYVCMLDKERGRRENECKRGGDTYVFTFIFIHTNIKVKKK